MLLPFSIVVLLLSFVSKVRIISIISVSKEEIIFIFIFKVVSLFMPTAEDLFLDVFAFIVAFQWLVISLSAVVILVILIIFSIGPLTF